MRSWISLAALFVAVAALGAWVYVYELNALTRAQHESYALSPLKAAEVKRIRLERAAGAPPAEGQAKAGAETAAPGVAAELERRDGAWRITAPFQARAELSQVERLLSILDARSAVRYAASDLERYGLAQPQARLTLDDQSFSYGAVNTMTREQYVLASDAVYAIPLAQRTAVPRDPDALISRSLLAPHEAPVRIELPGFSAALHDGAWIFIPAQAELSADERNAWADRWRQASAVRASKHHGHDAPSAAPEIKIGLKDGRTLDISIVQRDPELVLLRSDEGVQYHFFADTAKRLLSAPAPRN